MKELLGATVLAVLLLSQPVAIAAPWDHRPRLQGPERKGYQVQERRLPPSYPRGERPGPGRHDGYAGRLTEEERRELRGLPPRYPPGQRGKRPGPGRHDGYAGRLTEEERRALRRDVDRANREIYRQRPERR